MLLNDGLKVWLQKRSFCYIYWADSVSTHLEWRGEELMRWWYPLFISLKNIEWEFEMDSLRAPLECEYNMYMSLSLCLQCVSVCPLVLQIHFREV